MTDLDKVDKVRDEDELAEDLIRINSWLIVQPHLPQDIDEEFLTAFVYGTKNLEEAKNKLDSFYKQRGKYPKYFEFPNRDPLSKDFQESCQTMKVLFLPKTTDKNYRVMCIFPHEDFSKFDHQLFDNRWMMLLEMALFMWPKMAGVVLVMDLKGIDSSLLKKIDPALAAATMRWLQDTVPVRLKQVIYINAPPITDIIFNMIKPLLKRKLLDRVVISSEGAEVLKKYLPIDIFPEEYGGKEKSAAELNDYWMNKMIEKRDWFAKTSAQVTDETKRPSGTNKSFEDKGTFRYLQID